MGTKLNWCLTSVIQCERALKEIAQLHIEGDKTVGLNKRFSLIYKDAIYFYRALAVVQKSRTATFPCEKLIFTDIVADSNNV